MEYNTTREKLYFREYGRHVQQLVDYAASLEDKEKRNDVVQQIIQIMGALAPQLKNLEDFKYKLYHHLQIMSDFNMEFDSPYPPLEPETLNARPEHIGYPKRETKYRHYGRYVKRMIDKAIEEGDKEKQEEFTTCIGNYMKVVHQNWNHENVTDEVIQNDLEMISEGNLKLDESANLDTLARINSGKNSGGKRRRGKSNRGGGGKRRSHKNYR